MEPRIVDGNLMLCDVIFSDIYFVRWITAPFYLGIFFLLLNYA